MSDMVDALRGKLQKTEVQYTVRGHKDSHCGLCTHYVDKETCAIVAGKITPNGWCDRFKKG